jgi:RNA polymerase sigma factor (sigma-70 family)
MSPKPAELFACPVCFQLSVAPFDDLSAMFCLYKKERDDEVFARILDATHAPLREHAKSLCRQYDLPLDLISDFHNDVAMKLLRAAPHVDCKRPLLPYVKAIFTNRVFDYMKSRRRAKSLSRDDDAEDGSGGAGFAAEPAASIIADPAMQAQSNETIARIYTAIARLPSLECAMMSAKIEGNSRQAIADMFGATPEKVSRILHRARVHLRDDLC